MLDGENVLGSDLTDDPEHTSPFSHTMDLTALLLPMLSLAMLIIAVFTRDWSRLTVETTLWTRVLVDDYFGLWKWSTVMTTSSSKTYLEFVYSWCDSDDTMDQCHLLLFARILAIITVVLEAGTVISALMIECRLGRRSGFSADYAAIACTTTHTVTAILLLVVWNSVQDQLKAEDLTSEKSTIHFGFSYYFILISAIFCFLTDFCVLKTLSGQSSSYMRISPIKHSVDGRGVTGR